MNLVIQSAVPLAAEHIRPLTALARGSRTVHLDAYALRIEDAQPTQRADVDIYAATHKLDSAWLAPQRLTDYGLLAMDMDSTLITIECIDEIADFGGVKAQVAAITEASMRGEIVDFADSLRRRVALLKGLDAAVLEQVFKQRLALSPGATTLLEQARAAGLKTLLVSGGFTFFTERLQQQLGLDYTRANQLEIIDGRLTGAVLGEIIDAEAKARTVLDTCTALGIPASRAITLGDGSNDLQMMAVSGLSVAFRAKPVVRAAANVALNHVGLDGLPRLFI